MPTVCVDASFVLEILLRDEFAATAIRWWTQALRDETVARVPPLFHPEVTSAIRRRVYRKMLEQPDAQIVLTEALEWPVRVWEGDHTLLQRRAFDLAKRFGRSRAYDSQYLAVADFLGCELWTADQRLYNAVRSTLSRVRYVGETAA